MNICCSNINQHLTQADCRTVSPSPACCLVANQIMLEHISCFPWWESYILATSAFSLLKHPSYIFPFQTFGFGKLRLYKGIVTDLESHCGQTSRYPAQNINMLMCRTCGLKSEIGVWDLKSQLPTPCVTLAKSFNTLILQFPNCVTKRGMQRALWKLLIDHCLQSLPRCHWEKALKCMCLRDRRMLLHYYWNNGKYIVPKKIGERKRKSAAYQPTKEELHLVRDVWSCSSKEEHKKNLF